MGARTAPLRAILVEQYIQNKKADQVMTLLAVWKSDDTLFFAADTRLSTPGNVGSQRLTDHGVKLIPFSMNCFGPGADGFFTNLLLKRQFVLGFAGSSLVAQQTSLAISVFLGNLGAHPGTDFPSLQDIANLAARLIQQYTAEMAQLYSNPQQSVTECIVAGRCAQEDELQVFGLRTRICATSQPAITTSAIEVYPSQDLSDPLLLGDTTAREAMKSALSVPSPSTPLKILEGLVDESTTADVIGGGVQLGWIQKDDYQPVSLCRTPEEGKPAKFLNLGFDLSETADPSTLNGWVTGMPGYAK